MYHMYHRFIIKLYNDQITLDCLNKMKIDGICVFGCKSDLTKFHHGQSLQAATLLMASNTSNPMEY